MVLTNLWCEIDLYAMAQNLEKIRQKTDKKILAVVKCNAYGLGIEEITSFLENKVDGFVVADIDEALKVQSHKPILILLPTILDEDIPKIKDNFILTIDNMSMLKKLTGRPYSVHIFVNTGMHRFGVNCENVDELIKKIKNEYPNITIDGLYSHLNHPRNSRYTHKQLDIFKRVVKKYESFIPNIHVLNSNGFLHYNGISFDNCLRIGNLLYGNCEEKHGYNRVYCYKVRPVSISYVDKNQFVGYGNRYKTKKNTKIGILGVGYIHGFNCNKNIKFSLLQNLARSIYHSFKKETLVYYEGKPVEILGGSSMNFTITNFNGLQVDEQSVFEIQLSSILADTTIPKIYLNTDQESEVIDSLMEQIQHSMKLRNKLDEVVKIG